MHLYVCNQASFLFNKNWLILQFFASKIYITGSVCDFIISQ